MRKSIFFFAVVAIALASLGFLPKSPENKPAAATSSMSTFWDLHNSAYMDNLPVQVIEGRD
jgi:hypothetical protein